MKIIESQIVGKKSPETCEDGLVMTDDFVAVIDGSTSKTSRHLSPDMKNGRYAMVLISEYIRQGLKADATVDEFCQGITEYIYDKVYEPLGLVERLRLHPEERLAASVILYSKRRGEVWMVGDCQAIIGGELYENGKPYEQRVAERRVALMAHGMTPAEARRHIEPMLVEAMLAGQNKTYAVVDGFPIYRDGVRVVDSLHATSSTGGRQREEIVLASDGYPFLKSTLQDSEEALCELLLNDPQCTYCFVATKGLLPGNKSFDDRTYVRFEI